MTVHALEPHEKQGRKFSGPGYTIKQASLKTGFPVLRIRKAIERGELTAFSFGGQFVIPVSAVEKLIESLK